MQRVISQGKGMHRHCADNFRGVFIDQKGIAHVDIQGKNIDSLVEQFGKVQLIPGSAFYTDSFFFFRLLESFSIIITKGSPNSVVFQIFQRFPAEVSFLR